MSRRYRPPQEPPLDLFGKVRCTRCGAVLRIVRSRALKTRRETRVVLYCNNCGARYRLRLEQV
jgi:transcription elongation factor Elf1